MGPVTLKDVICCFFFKVTVSGKESGVRLSQWTWHRRYTVKPGN